MVLVAAALLASFCPVGLGAQALRAGEIAFLDGEVTVDGRAAQVGQAVVQGAAIETGPASTCEVVWGRDNIIRFQEQTLAAPEVAGQAPEIRLEPGAVAAVLNRLDWITRRGTFRVRTPAAVASVRRAAFFVKVEDSANSYVCAWHGELGVARGLGGTVDPASSRHVARRFTRADRRRRRGRGRGLRILRPTLLPPERARGLELNRLRAGTILSAMPAPVPGRGA